MDVFRLAEPRSIPPRPATAAYSTQEGGSAVACHAIRCDQDAMVQAHLLQLREEDAHSRAANSLGGVLAFHDEIRGKKSNEPSCRLFQKQTSTSLLHGGYHAHLCRRRYPHNGPCRLSESCAACHGDHRSVWRARHRWRRQDRSAGKWSDAGADLHHRISERRCSPTMVPVRRISGGIENPTVSVARPRVLDRGYRKFPRHSPWPVWMRHRLGAEM